MSDDPYLSPRRGGTEVYLVRHADARPSPADVAHGDYDAQRLSARGRAQAHAAAQRLALREPSAVYASPILRASETAGIIAAACGCDVRYDDDLREVRIAQSATGGAEAINTFLVDLSATLLREGMWSAVPNAEDATTVRRRASAAVQRIVAAHPGERVVVVSHGGTINAFLAAALAVPRDYFVPLANASISTVRLRAPHVLVLTVNDASHLETLPAEAGR